MSADGPSFLKPDWPAPPGVHAAVSLRTGGVSEPPFDTLNLGASSGDVAQHLAENRRRVRLALGLPDEPVWLNQVHGALVLDLDPVAPRSAAMPAPPADAAVTHRAGRVAAITIADCMPVLFAARDGRAVGAAHAGWRGLAGGVLEATVRALAVPASTLIAWLGPAISQRYFEVGEDVRTAFCASDPQSVTAFEPNARGRWQCDLYALARRRLAALGVSAVYGGDYCTYAERQRFFSYRRDGRCGRMAALIWIAH
ncbi:MAG TPA: peptidoglycan editing factor PgeF [Steroidobacteraceae bacterium]|nr:peptidoglycan editing factor PgeF [Steroidobacteraceae bacterium]